MLFPCDLLLKQRNWHLNLCDKNGFLSEGGTFYAGDDLPDLAASRGLPGSDANEVVFHDRISVRLCSRVLCRTPEAMAAVKTAVASLKGRGPIPAVSHLPAARFQSRRIRLRSGAAPFLDLTSEPCRVFYTDINYTGVPCGPRKSSSVRFVRQVAMRAGYTPASLSGKSAAQIEKMLAADGAYTRCMMSRARPIPPGRHKTRYVEGAIKKSHT
jgi:hypothetical protein